MDTSLVRVADFKQTIIERLSNGDKLKHIAADLGIHRVSISRALARDPEYQVAISEAIDARLEDAEIQLEESGAHGHVAVTLAREVLAHQRWRAERLLPGKYAPVKQAVQVNAADGQVQVNIVSWNDSEHGQ